MKVAPDKKIIPTVETLYKKHLYIDVEKGLLMFETTPVILTRTELLYNIYKVLVHKIGNDAYQLLYDAAKEHGKSFYNYFINPPKTIDKSEFESARDKIVLELAYEDLVSGESANLRKMAVRYMCLDSVVAGWGWIDVEESENCITITSHAGFPVGQEFKNRNETSSLPVDVYFLGYFGGLLSAMDNCEYKGEEVECVAKGDLRCVLSYRR